MLQDAVKKLEGRMRYQSKINDKIICKFHFSSVRVNA